MAFNFDKVARPARPHVLLRDSKPGVALSDHCNIHGFSMEKLSDMHCVMLLAGDRMWKHRLSLPHDHARALAYLLLLATSGPLERAAVIADAKAEGLDIGGITSTTP